MIAKSLHSSFMPTHLRQFDLLILSQIAEHPSYGYELLLYFQETPSTIYYALRKIHAEGLTKTRKEERQKTPHATRHFITRKGRLVLQEALQDHIILAHDESKKLLDLYRHEREVLLTLFQIKHARLSDNQFRVQ